MKNGKFNRNYLSKDGKTQQVTLNLLMLEMPQACNFIKKEALARLFSCEFCEISKNTFFAEPLWWREVLKMFIFGLTWDL